MSSASCSGASGEGAAASAGCSSSASSRAAISSSLGSRAASTSRIAADEEERDLGQAGHDRDEADRAAAELERALVPRELLEQVGTEVALGCGAGHDQAGRERDQQRGDLRDEPVADGEQAVGLDGLAERQVLLQHADGEAADEVDRRR